MLVMADPISLNEDNEMFSLPAGHRIIITGRTDEDDLDDDEAANKAPTWMRYLPKRIDSVLRSGPDVLSQDPVVPLREDARLLRMSGSPPRRKYRIRCNRFGPPENLPSIDLPCISGVKRSRTDPLDSTSHGDPFHASTYDKSTASDVSPETGPCSRRRRVHSSHVGEVAALLSFTKLTHAT